MKNYFFFTIISLILNNAQAQNIQIQKTIFMKDSLFWHGYNTCNYDLMRQYLDKNVEFLHDKGGRMEGADKVIDATRKNICGMANIKVKREPLTETVNIFPLEDKGKIYGAIISGEHYFYQNDIQTGIAKFTHTWFLKDGEWLMHRVLSYDHRNAKKSDQLMFSMSESALNQFVGKYDSPQFGIVEIKQTGKNLQLLNAGETMELLPKAENTFFVKDKNLEFKFEKGVKFDVIENGQKVDEVKLVVVPQKITNIFASKAEIEEYLNGRKIPALGFSVIKNGKIEQMKVFGNLKEGIAAPENTIFNVASLTKPVVAYLTLKLVSQGKWKLDEPLYKYWIDPDLKNDNRYKKLTTRLVLSHQTGFPNWRYSAKDKDQKLTFLAEPGTKYGYSGEGFEYLRKALEKKFNKTLELLIEENVFKPLKMNDTYMKWSEKVDENRFAIGHNSLGQAYQIHKENGVSAADDLLTTIEDYSKFLLALIQGNGLKKAIFEEMQSNQLKTKDNKYFVLGLEKYDIGNSEYALSHGGSDEGCRTIFLIYPKTKDGLLLFTNSDNGMTIYEPAFKEFMKENGQKVINIEMKK
jgi:CubicO group peptidase (beta-lactamase class C family)